MNMSKYLLLSVVSTVVLASNAESAVAAKVEDSVMATAQEPVVVNNEATIESQPAVNDRELPDDQDADFAEFAKKLEMSEEEQAQFLAEMNADMDQEAEDVSDDVQKKNENTTSLKTDKNMENNVEEKTLPEAKVIPVKTELPKAVK